MPRRALPFKACLKCKLLVLPKVEICPHCGSRDFTDDWEGMIIITNPSKSELANLLNIDKPGKYALKVR